MISVTSLSLDAAPEHLRKALCYEKEEIRNAGIYLSKRTRASFILLVTCNRAEVWYEDNGQLPASMLSRALSLKESETAQYASSLSGRDALMYMFRLSTGILSPYFGEEVITSQLSLAAECARSTGSISAVLDELFRRAIAFARMVHSSFKVRVFDIERTEAVIPLLKGRRVLVIGSGEEARMLSSTLVLSGFTVHECIRDISKADFLIPRGVKAIPYDERLAEAEWAESVISISSSIGYTLTLEELKLFSGAKLFDFASPSDFPPEADAVRNVDAPSPQRDAVKERVEALAVEECDRFELYLEKRSALPQASEYAVNTASRFIRKVSSLLELEENESLASLLYEECRKASVSAYFETFRKR